MNIRGIDGLSVGQVQDEVRDGARFVIFGYAMSFLVVTLRRSSDVHFIRPGKSTFGAGLPYTLLSLMLGWWGFPWGLIYTPTVVVQNLSGGRDVTAEVMQSMLSPGQTS